MPINIYSVGIVKIAMVKVSRSGSKIVGPQFLPKTNKGI